MSLQGNFVLDELLLDIFKDFGYQSIMLQAMEDSVLKRTGCRFDILHGRVLPQQTYLESQGVEDFIDNDSRYFQLSLEDNYKVELKSNVSCLLQSENKEDGEEVTLDLSNSYIKSCADLVKKCERRRNASSAILTGSNISSETWLFGVMEILRWFCPFLRRIDITRCKGISRQNLTVGRNQSSIEVFDNYLLDPSVIANYPNANEEINGMLERKSFSPRKICQGWSLLHSAIFLGDTQLVRKLLEVMAKDNGYDNYNTEEDLMQTALELATALHNLEIIKLLKSKNVAYKDPSMLVRHCFLKQISFETFDHPVIEAVVSDEEAALKAARTLHDTWQCDVAAVLLTLCENSNVHFKRKVFEEILQRVHSCLKRNCCLLFSCGKETAIRDFLKMLMNEDEVLGHQRIDDFPCLMFSLPSLNLIELLLSEGANINDRDKSGCTALFHAVEKALDTSTPYCFDLMTFLLNKEANPNVRNDLGDSLLSHSLRWCSRSCKLCRTMMTHETLNSSPDGPFSLEHIVEVWRLLLSFGARGNVKDEKDRSLLHLLLTFFEKEYIAPSIRRDLICTDGLTLLLNGGLDINARDAKGNTPLHCWANISNEMSSDDLIQIGSKLVLSGGAVNARNDKCETPLHFAQSWEQVDFLVDKGAGAAAQDLYGNTPFHKFIERVPLITHQVEEGRWKRCLASGMNPFSANYHGTCLFDVLLEKHFFKSTLNLLKVIFESDVNEQLRETARAYRNRNGDSLLHIACVVENNDALLVCDYLLRNGWGANLQNKCDETPLLLACRNVENVDSVLSNNILLLRRHHADASIPDGHGSTCDTLLRDDLRVLLVQEVERVSLPNQIKWTQQSVKHRGALTEVAFGLKTQKVDNFYHHEDPIGTGAFGLVFPGLNDKDGREVAIKRLEKARLEQRGTVLEREIKCLQELADCSFVLNYISCASDKNFQYLVVELMEGSLDDYLPNNEVCEEAFTICLNIGNGLEFLHHKNVLHRDLKPQNILYKTQPEFVVKISDFGISKILHGVQSGPPSETVLNSRMGTRCWMAPELLKKNPKDHSKKSDIFSCGLIFHYVLAMKQHPFGSYSKESLAEINPQETERNITNDKKCFCKSLTHEAKDLVMHMLLPKPDRRPITPSLQKFPFFWDNQTKVDFLTKVGNQEEFEEPRPIVNRQLSDAEKNLEQNYLAYLNGASNDWAKDIQDVYDEMTRAYTHRKYETTSAVELVRFIRNSYNHLRCLSPGVRNLLSKDFVFLRRFPFLVTAVYRAVKGCRRLRGRDNLKNFFQ